MTYKVQYGTTTIEYELSYAARRTLAINVHPDLRVIVTAPEDSNLDDIAAKVRKRGAWILRHLQEFETYLPHLPAREYVSGETHRYLGKQYRLKVIEDTDEHIKLASGRLFVHVHNTQNKEHIKNLLDNWYRSHAQRVFVERLELCFPRVSKYGLAYPEMEIRQMEKRWGSCTAEGKILLNLKLMQVSKTLIDYVIMHELCHLKEYNHGSAFYNLLDRAMPDWRERRKKLNEMDVA